MGLAERYKIRAPLPIVPSLLILYAYEVFPLSLLPPKAGRLKRRAFDVSFTPC